MNYTLLPSLEHIALVRIATTFWNQDDICTLTAKFCCKEWQTIEDKVIEKISKLPLPESLKKKVLDFIKPIGLEILKWRQYHENFLSEMTFIRRNLNRLSWTPQGTVDKKKTAEVLIKDENLDITKRYKLACNYCLENDIPALWSKIPESRRKSFYSEKNPMEVYQQALIILWTYDIKGQLARLSNMVEKWWLQNCTTYQDAFEYAAVGGNKAATEHFLQKLTPQEREESLVKTTGYVANRRCSSARNDTDFPKEHYTDVLCFLLSKMDEEQQIEVFKRYSYRVLKCFLDWPWQSFFMEMAKRMWPFLPEKHYDSLLGEFVNKIIDGYKDYNYQKLFGIFWRQSPTTCKRYVIDECASGFLLSNLLKIEDKENTRLILKDANLIEKNKLILSNRGQDICEYLIYSGQWSFLEFFIQECMSSKNEMVKFRKEFKRRVASALSWSCSRGEFFKRKGEYDKFFELLDGLIQENIKKRGTEEENGSSAKKLHSTELEEVVHSMKK